MGSVVDCPAFVFCRAFLICTNSVGEALHCFTAYCFVKGLICSLGIVQAMTDRWQTCLIGAHFSLSLGDLNKVSFAIFGLSYYPILLSLLKSQFST